MDRSAPWRSACRHSQYAVSWIAIASAANTATATNLTREVAEQRRACGQQRDRQERQEGEPDQQTVPATDLAEHPLVRPPGAADDGEAQQVDEELWTEGDQAATKVGSGHAGWQPDVQHQQGQGDGDDAIAQRLQARHLDENLGWR